MPRETISSDDHGENVVQVGWSREAEYVQVATTPPPDPHGGYYATLDRAAINKLITVLRRARDQAFGADA